MHHVMYAQSKQKAKKHVTKPVYPVYVKYLYNADQGGVRKQTASMYGLSSMYDLIII